MLYIQTVQSVNECTPYNSLLSFITFFMMQVNLNIRCLKRNHAKPIELILFSKRYCVKCYIWKGVHKIYAVHCVYMTLTSLLQVVRYSSFSGDENMSLTKQ